VDDQGQVANLEPPGAAAVPSAARLQAEDIALVTGKGSPTLARIVRREDAERPLPVVLCLDGPCGLDGSETENGFVHELVAVGLAALVPYGSPIDDEGIHRVLCWIAHDGQRRGLDGERIAVLGSGTSGAIAAAALVLAARRGGPAVRALIVTSEARNTCESDAHAAATFLGDLLGAIRPDASVRAE
jgi:acetyl esterase/lipase